MYNIPQQEFTTEFKDPAVQRVKGVQAFSKVAKDLRLVEQTLRNWVKAAKAGKLSASGNKPVTVEQMELSRLRMECAILENHPPGLPPRSRI